jgi:hypothetical protein
MIRETIVVGKRRRGDVSEGKNLRRTTVWQGKLIYTLMTVAYVK